MSLHSSHEDLWNAVIASVSSLPVTIYLFVYNSIYELIIGMSMSVLLFILGKTVDVAVKIYLHNKEMSMRHRKAEDDETKETE
jgi:flagellar biosynthesis protein FlhB